MQLTKKHGFPAKYGALHPQFQTAEFFVTRAFDRIEPLLSAELFKQIDLATLGKNAEEKQGQLLAAAGPMKITFDADSGAVRRLVWDNGETVETLVLGEYKTPESAMLPKFMEWTYTKPPFKLHLDFVSPAITPVP
jgi:hypothetical protein